MCLVTLYTINRLYEICRPFSKIQIFGTYYYLEDVPLVMLYPILYRTISVSYIILFDYVVFKFRELIISRGCCFSNAVPNIKPYYCSKLNYSI